jgi:peptide/nickel transport system permease protein
MVASPEPRSRRLSAASAVRRLIDAVSTLLLTFLLCFFLLHSMPGDPADRLDSPDIPAAQAERNRRALGLDRPLLGQLGTTVVGYLRGDLGVSFAHKRPVIDVLATALPPTAALGIAAMTLAYGLGLPLALLLISLPGRWRRALDRLLLAAATLPRFWLSVMLVLLLHDLAGWFPASHAAPPGGGNWLDRLRHLVLPGLALGLPAAFVVARFQLAAMERTLAKLHVNAARAAGGGGWSLLLRHVLRPSIGPAIALFGLDLPVLVSGAIVVELIFAWPGLGQVAAQAVLGADYPLALGSVMLSGTAVLLGRMVAEWLADRLLPARAASHDGGRP